MRCGWRSDILGRMSLGGATFANSMGHVYDTEAFATGDSDSARATWSYTPFGTLRDSTSIVKFYIYVNGTYNTSTTDKHALISGLSSRHPTMIEIFPTPPHLNDSDIIAVEEHDAGGRVKLSWTLDADNTTGDRILIYYNAGTGVVSYTTSIGQAWYDDNEWVSDELVDGDYIFGLNSIDATGNKGATPTEVSASVDTPPDATATLVATFDDTADTISLTWPDVTNTDFAEFHIYWNGGDGVVDYSEPFAREATSVYETYHLWEGDWKFGVVSVDEAGNLSEPTESNVIYLKVISDDLVNATPPAMITNLKATALATEGLIELTWTLPSVTTNLERFLIFRATSEAALDYDVIYDTELDETATSYEDNDCVEGVTYYYNVLSANDNLFHLSSEHYPDVVWATSDSTAPGIPTGLTAEVIE